MSVQNNKYLKDWYDNLPQEFIDWVYKLEEKPYYQDYMDQQLKIYYENKKYKFTDGEDINENR